MSPLSESAHWMTHRGFPFPERANARLHPIRVIERRYAVNVPEQLTLCDLRSMPDCEVCWQPAACVLSIETRTGEDIVRERALTLTWKAAP
jgi:hypothetical protein